MNGRDLIRVRRGNKRDLGELEFGEIAYVMDEDSLYVGTMNGNSNLTKGSAEYKELEDLVNSHSEEHHHDGSDPISIDELRNYNELVKYRIDYLMNRLERGASVPLSRYTPEDLIEGAMWYEEL